MVKKILSRISFICFHFRAFLFTVLSYRVNNRIQDGYLGLLLFHLLVHILNQTKGIITTNLANRAFVKGLEGY